MSTTPPPRILVADDDPILRELLVEVLTQFGAVVVQAENGEAAVKEAMSAPFDLCILDIDMPTMSGLEACPIIRSCAFSHDVPILFLTGHSDSAAIHQAFAVGGSDFLSKPIHPTLLWRRASNLILLRKLSEKRDNLQDMMKIMESPPVSSLPAIG
jgi:CheY-like chemotaxis protein